ncbi:hypothetical protein G7072_01510 [Nocardioides sp. HDW12B]|uniref:hypothetical protein n=1 Tax=Nocardioides sp. HDW12B TaxID=2714939 RepID=UPI00140C126E|nr:hypothetical protein [Nocardioides sp. HDW12B]QIK65188.1 hypothetical protein G7072_01510 [Nocardioides sp. HDW12B]
MTAAPGSPTSPTASHPPWLGLAAAGLVTLLLLLGVGALGIVGDGGRDDAPYLLAPVVAVVGVLLARLSPHGSAVALGAAAGVVVAVALGWLVVGLPAGASALDVVGVSGMYAVLYAGAAWLCLRRSRAR